MYQCRNVEVFSHNDPNDQLRKANSEKRNNGNHVQSWQLTWVEDGIRTHGPQNHNLML